MEFNKVINILKTFHAAERCQHYEIQSMLYPLVHSLWDRHYTPYHNLTDMGEPCMKTLCYLTLMLLCGSVAMAEETFLFRVREQSRS